MMGVGGNGFENVLNVITKVSQDETEKCLNVLMSETPLTVSASLESLKLSLRCRILSRVLIPCPFKN
jgi:hypothetical protein